MTLALHNTLTGFKEQFTPLQPGHVLMYTCGPTVWNFAHVGNLRAFLFYDLVRRHLQVSGYRITHVMNLTDIDDRILDQAMHAGVTISDYVKPYEKAFFEDMIALRAIVLPNVGPIDFEEKFFVPGTEELPNFASSALLISFTLSGRSVFVEIW